MQDYLTRLDCPFEIHVQEKCTPKEPDIITIQLYPRRFRWLVGKLFRFVIWLGDFE